MPALGPSRFWRYRYNKNVAHAALPEFESWGTVETGVAASSRSTAY